MFSIVQCSILSLYCICLGVNVNIYGFAPSKPHHVRWIVEDWWLRAFWSTWGPSSWSFGRAQFDAQCRKGRFYKWGYPKLDGSWGTILLKWVIYGYPHFRTLSYIQIGAIYIWGESASNGVIYIYISWDSTNPPKSTPRIPRMITVCHGV